MYNTSNGSMAFHRTNNVNTDPTYYYSSSTAYILYGNRETRSQLESTFV